MASSNQSIINAVGGMLWHAQSSTFQDSEKVLSNKIVLLYFSASWCAPCQHFTPKLSQMYNTLKANANKDVSFEIVFASMDKTEEQYATYCEKMPFYAMPWDSKIVATLARQFNAQGIPHLVVLDTDGSVILEDGVSELSMDPTGIHFPWRPKPLPEILPSYYLNSNKEVKPMSDLDGKYLMLYFSAHWCPPCRNFTPLLAKAYTKLKQSTLGAKFELLFVSADESQDEFDGYFKDMNFGAIPFADEAKFALTKRLQVRGYPTLLMLSVERELINPNIRGIIENGDYISDFPYLPKPYGDLNHTPSDINDHRCIIVFHEGGDDEEQEDVVDAIKAASAQYPELIMYWATTVSQVTQSVRGALTLGAITPNPVLILLDIPDNGGYYVCENKGEITDEMICQFVEQPGKRIQIQG